MSPRDPTGPNHIAFDASKDVLVAGVLHAGDGTPTVERVANDPAAVRRFVKKFPEPAKLRTCYEAGPGGYELHRLLGFAQGGVPGDRPRPYPPRPR